MPPHMMPEGASTTGGSLNAISHVMWLPSRKHRGLNSAGGAGFSVLDHRRPSGRGRGQCHGQDEATCQSEEEPTKPADRQMTLLSCPVMSLPCNRREVLNGLVEQRMGIVFLSAVPADPLTSAGHRVTHQARSGLGCSPLEARRNTCGIRTATCAGNSLQLGQAA